MCSEANLSKQDGEGKYTVGNDASTDDQGTVFDGPVLQQIGVILGILFYQLGVIIWEGDKPSQGNSSQSILHIFALQLVLCSVHSKDKQSENWKTMLLCKTQHVGCQYLTYLDKCQLKLDADTITSATSWH